MVFCGSSFCARAGAPEAARPSARARAVRIRIKGLSPMDELAGLELAPQHQVLASFAVNRRSTLGGTKAETSPPIAAIWRTRVALIGRTAGEAGRNTVLIEGSKDAFIPAICIS